MTICASSASTLASASTYPRRLIRRLPQPDPVLGGPVMACALCGHRPQKLPFGAEERDPRCALLRTRAYETMEMLVWQGYTHFLSGGALGFDTMAGELVLALRARYPWVSLELVVPFDGQDLLWRRAARQRYRALLSQADIITWTGGGYGPGVYRQRNHYLVDHCQLLLAAYDGHPGGTADTIAYAKARRVGMTILPTLPINAAQAT